MRYQSLSDAFCPLLMKGPHVFPLLPFVVHVSENTNRGHSRTPAVARLRCVPYDAMVVIGEKIDRRRPRFLAMADHRELLQREFA